MKTRALILSGGLPVVLVSALVAWWFLSQRFGERVEPTAMEEPANPSLAAPLTIALPAEKLSQAGVSVTEAARKSIRQENFVPGRLQYDDRRHIEIRSAASGIITEIHVKPGERVAAGDVLIELNSPEVGDARADVLQRQADLDLAKESQDWQDAICTGLQKLSDSVRRRASVDEIRSEFKNTVLGKTREQVLAAYSDLLLAESMFAAAEDNARNGIVPSRIVEQRRNERDNAEATLLGAIEELQFSAKHSLQQAKARFADAGRRFRISLQTVRTLLGKVSSSTSEHPSAETLNAELGLDQPLLSMIQLRAPFAGTIEQRTYSTNERVDAGASLMILADTSMLWVAADLREREWNALSLQPGDRVRVVTSLPGLESLTADVHFVGREVDPATNAIPLVAVVNNPDGRLRPGMFVRVVVPVSSARDALTIPESSLLEHDRQAFVFIPEGEGTFRRVNITPGVRTGGTVEVVSGLRPGDKVVASGGFFLKSELLLQGEAE